jgi:transposase-like protein
LGKKYGPDSAKHQELAEIRQLKKEGKRDTEQRDILKKAAAYLASQSGEDTPLLGLTIKDGLFAGSVTC